jgi:hypothetical protein
MPRRSTSHPLDAIRRQLGRVRWRHDLREAQRALYLLVAVGGAAGTVALLLALCGSVRLFAYGSAGVAGLALLTVGLLGRDARRRLLGTARAAAWADRRGSLEGRLATLLEIGARDLGRQEAFFWPLLLDENVRRLTLWRPERLVPRRLPRAPLAAGLGAAAALVATLALAPWLRPTPPAVAFLTEPVGNLAPTDLTPDRVLVAPAAQHGSPSSGEPGAPPAAPGAGAAGGQPSLLARLQERIRERVWGPSWEPPGDPTRSADAERGRPRGNAHATSGADADDERTGTVPTVGSESRQELAKVARAARRANRGNREGKEARGETSLPERGSGAEGEPEQTGTDGAASGAGTATSPDLFGPPSSRRASESETFALALAAPGRGSSPMPAPPSGEPPPASDDERPALAAGQRSETPLTKMPVPPAYESLVRRLFAHGAGAMSP